MINYKQKEEEQRERENNQQSVIKHIMSSLSKKDIPTTLFVLTTIISMMLLLANNFHLLSDQNHTMEHRNDERKLLMHTSSAPATRLTSPAPFTGRVSPALSVSALTAPVMLFDDEQFDAATRSIPGTPSPFAPAAQPPSPGHSLYSVATAPAAIREHKQPFQSRPPSATTSQLTAATPLPQREDYQPATPLMSPASAMRSSYPILNYSPALSAATAPTAIRESKQPFQSRPPSATPSLQFNAATQYQLPFEPRAYAQSMPTPSIPGSPSMPPAFSHSPAPRPPPTAEAIPQPRPHASSLTVAQPPPSIPTAPPTAEVVPQPKPQPHASSPTVAQRGSSVQGAVPITLPPPSALRSTSTSAARNKYTASQKSEDQQKSSLLMGPFLASLDIYFQTRSQNHSFDINTTTIVFMTILLEHAPDRRVQTEDLKQYFVWLDKHELFKGNFNHIQQQINKHKPKLIEVKNTWRETI